jgi:two-component system, NarL family, response regulator LiaR
MEGLMSRASNIQSEIRPGGARAGRAARLVLADDHDLVREGIRAVLEGEPDLLVVGEAANGRQALEVCRKAHPDLVLMDVRMPEMDGLEATKAIKEELPHTSVVMVTMHESPEYLLEAIKAGAAGYILKDAGGERLIEAVKRTLEGEAPLSEGLAMQLLRRLASEDGQRLEPLPEAKRRKAKMPNGITPREVEVLRLLARGRTNPQIAQDLMVSRGTVKIHVQNIIAKLGVSDRTQAAVRAIELGIFEPDTGW